MLLSSMIYGLAAAACVCATPMLQILEHRYVDPDSRLRYTILDDGMPLVERSSRSVALESREISKSKSIDIARRWQNKRLFDGTLAILPLHKTGGEPGSLTNLKLTCIDCWTNGTIDVSFTTGDVKKSIVEAAKSLFKKTHENHTATVSHLVDVIRPNLRIDLSNVQLYAHFDIKVSTALTYSIPIWEMDITPFIRTQNIFKIGPSLFFELIFLAATSVDIETGFHIILPPNCFLDVDVGNRTITNHLFQGVKTKTLPVKVELNDVVFTAALRITLGFDLSVGPSIEVADYKGLTRPGFANPGHSDLDPSPQEEEDGETGEKYEKSDEDEDDDKHEEDDKDKDKDDDQDEDEEKENDEDEDETHQSDKSSNTKRSVIHRRSVGAGAGVQVYLNILEWATKVTPDLKGTTNCTIRATTHWNMNVGVGAYIAAGAGHAMMGYMPNHYWILAETKPKETCLKKNTRMLPTRTSSSHMRDRTSTADFSAVATGSPEITPGPNKVVVQQILTVCKTELVNCPADMVVSVTVNNTVDASVATGLPGSSLYVRPGEDEKDDGKSHGLRAKLKNIAKKIFKRDELQWDTVEWIPMTTLVPMTTGK